MVFLNELDGNDCHEAKECYRKFSADSFLGDLSSDATDENICKWLNEKKKLKCFARRQTVFFWLCSYIMFFFSEDFHG